MQIRNPTQSTLGTQYLLSISQLHKHNNVYNTSHIQFTQLSIHTLSNNIITLLHVTLLVCKQL